MSEAMFCMQCQETAASRGCNRTGMCGKKPETAAMQDLLVHSTKALACVLVRMRKDGAPENAEADRTVRENLSATATNVNFDTAALEAMVTETLRQKEDLIAELDEEQRSRLYRTALFAPAEGSYAEAAGEVGVLATEDADVRSLRELVSYGLKGMAQFAAQAAALGADTLEIDDFLQRALVDLQNEAMTGGNLLALVMETGRFGLKVMELLVTARRERYGRMQPTEVALGTKDRPGILVSGSDMHVLAQLLSQSADAGIDVYTHGDLFSAHAYPELKKYPQLAGHYGGSWWEQKEQFESFGGPVIVAGDGLVPPKESYADRLYTAGAARYPGVAQVERRDDGSYDFSAVIERAKTAPAPRQLTEGTTPTGCDEGQIFALAEPLAQALKEEKIKKFVVLAGADGRAKTRGYYADLARRLPEDAVLFTAGSIRNRFLQEDFGKIGDLPRQFDFGALEDAWALIQTAGKLGEAAGGGKLPIVYNYAWYDQKSLLFLYALFYLDIHNVHVGPTFPAALTPSVRDILVKYFGIAEIGTVDHDLEKFFGGTTELVRGDMIVSEIVNTYPQLVPVMLGEGLHCISCGVSEMETLDEACQVHGLDTADILDLLNGTLAQGA